MLIGFLVTALIVAIIVIIILAVQNSPEAKKEIELSRKANKKKRFFMTDGECQKEFEAHKPNVSASVLSKLKKIQRLYLEGQGVIQFQNLAGCDIGQGYSLRVRVKKGENYRVICFSYNTSGKFYSIQDTGGHGGYLGEKGDFVCSYQF